MYLAKGAVADTSANRVELPTYHACILALSLEANTASPNCVKLHLEAPVYPPDLLTLSHAVVEGLNLNNLVAPPANNCVCKSNLAAVTLFRFSLAALE
jgi:hypothetical protein